MKTKTKHIHQYRDGKSGKIAICDCGRFKHINLKEEDIIKEVKHTPPPLNEWVIRDAGNTLVGDKAHKLYFHFNQRLPEIFKLQDDERFFVFEADGKLVAGQSTKELAMKYMNENRILVYRDEPIFFALPWKNKNEFLSDVKLIGNDDKLQFIVRAVNSHEALLEIAKTTLGQLEKIDWETSGFKEKAISHIKTIVALAEGE